MKPRKLLLALALFALPFGMSAQCKFSTDKNQPGLEYIRQTIGTGSLQWSMAVGKNSSKYYLMVSIADEGANKHVMGANDRVFLDLASGERMSFTPTGAVNPQVNGGNTHYDTRFEISREEMEKISITPLDRVAAVIDNREIGNNVKDGLVSKIMEAAGCVIK